MPLERPRVLDGKCMHLRIISLGFPNVYMCVVTFASNAQPLTPCAQTNYPMLHTCFTCHPFSFVLSNSHFSQLPTCLNLVAIPQSAPACPCPSTTLTSGGGPTGLIMRSSNCTLVFSRGCPRPMLMYCSIGGCPMKLESESRAMFDVHSYFVVSADPIPM